LTVVAVAFVLSEPRTSDDVAVGVGAAVISLGFAFFDETNSSIAARVRGTRGVNCRDLVAFNALVFRGSK